MLYRCLLMQEVTSPQLPLLSARLACVKAGSQQRAVFAVVHGLDAPELPGVAA
jgi:hypothetical protein